MGVTKFGEWTEIAPGTIVMWSGTLSSVPAGWVLCDGLNGTPDMRGRFAKCVPDSGTDPGTTGGSESLTLSTSQLPSHNHNGSSNSTDNVGGHRHTYNRHQAIDSSDTDLWSDESSGQSRNIPAAGGHSHSISVGSAGSGASIENRPSFYQLAFIMKT